MEQISVVAYSVVLGAILGIIYDIFRTIRLFIDPKNLGMFIQDVIYFLLSGLITFLFVLIFNFGESRFYILAGEAVGWCAYHISVGDWIYRALKSFCKTGLWRKKEKLQK